MINLYKCNLCGKSVERESNKKRIQSICRDMGYKDSWLIKQNIPDIYPMVTLEEYSTKRYGKPGTARRKKFEEESDVRIFDMYLHRQLVSQKKYKTK